ncbi:MULTISPECIES: malate synthase A [Streptomyces]|uniref:Malate synthase n=1 Tax=Streptomyces griseus subsp. griseus (strain JCM 4626 / CBS 651.72 / NBRC 13350 / KCC S-0626 / ISP 5235) TaxID=455632 RepID=B1VVE2_STRGG|nr:MULTISPECIES: malate synthase A [Streptomyces]NEB52358.1 malate synthase A [Streptomyces griseus]SCE55594.1 malate synthase [Streptomyces sp. OspMP-M43]SED57148.1 malate synthase [Streptomyces griseus]SQA22498.1 Malate synthase [Streptomyces griseus]BAG18126.1 putative malate synthase [Streptomyces griseus subsp. griseus NBRC 13350]
MSAPAPSTLAIVDAEPLPRQEEVLTDAALAFVAELHRQFTPRRNELLARRGERRAEIARTSTLDFLPETAAVRADTSWKVAPAPAALNDRRVEITGPTDRKMTINALNSGAKVWLADFEDASAPTWENVVLGQLNLTDAYERRIDFTDPKSGKSYALKSADELATVVMRPRGWHLEERHLQLDGVSVPGALVDFGLYFFHNAQRLIDLGKGPYFYLPKTESHLEARLWNDVFVFAQDYVGIPQGTVRATVLIETITAAYEMEEILYELRDHAAGLNAGRWDYLFSIVKNFRDGGSKFVLPDRNAVTMTAPFMRAYTELLVRTCHKRGAHAIGGMAAFIPSRRDAEVNKVAFEKVKADKDREANDGFDGSWVAHPDLVPIALASFDAVLGEKPNQKDRLREDVSVAPGDLIAIDTLDASPTYDGLRNAVAVGIRYIEAWLRGLGAVAIFNLMEDAATAEISRSQIWQWINAGVVFENGEHATADLARKVAAEELAAIREEIGEETFTAGKWQQAHDLLLQVSLDQDYADFLTLPAYEQLR